jgi:hypothetical protein
LDCSQARQLFEDFAILGIVERAGQRFQLTALGLEASRGLDL